MNCPNITPLPDEGCQPSFAGLGRTIYIGPVMSDGSLPKLEEMTAVELASQDGSIELNNESGETKEESSSFGHKDGYTLSFNVTARSDDSKKIFGRLFGTLGLTRRRIVRERKSYNALRRNLRNPIRAYIPMYKKHVHRAVVYSLPIQIEIAKIAIYKKEVKTYRQMCNWLYEEQN